MQPASTRPAWQALVTHPAHIGAEVQAVLAEQAARDDAAPTHDSSTNALIQRYRQLREERA